MRLLKNAIMLLCTLLFAVSIASCAAQEIPASNIDADITNIENGTDILIDGGETGSQENDNSTEAVENSIDNMGNNSESIENESNDKEKEDNEYEYEEEVEENEEDNIKKDGFVFVYNGINIYLGENIERVLSELGKENDYHESPSCSFEGMDKLYSYNGFQISNYKKHKTDCDRVNSVRFNDDSVTTTEGIYIGQTYDNMVEVYGKDYEEISGLYRYIKEGTVLAFSIDEAGSIYSIEYQIEDIYG